MTAFPHRRVEVPPRLERVGARVEQLRAGRGGREIPDRIAVGVLVSGFVLCTIGALVTPTVSVANADLGLVAQLLATVFWGAALIGAVGLFFRLRRGLVGAFIASLAFLGSPVLAAIIDHGVVGRRWTAELVCAVEFVLLCVGALRSTGNGVGDPRTQDPHGQQAH